jgi:hypothetical protein
MIDGCSGGSDALFEVQKVADGVHVAVAARAYKVNCNTALIETDDGVLVVDSHSKPSAARVVVEQIRAITSKPVRYVVNTHFHWDHWQGNEAYPAAYGHVEVITNDITREAIVRKSLKRIQDHVRQMPAEIEGLRAQLAGATSAAARGSSARLRQAGSLRRDHALEPALPTIAFSAACDPPAGRDILSTSGARTPGATCSSISRGRIVVTGTR